MLELDIIKKLKGFTLEMAFRSTEKGGAVALFGPSGTGKSLTLQVIAGLVRPDAGRIGLNGQTLFDSQKRLNVPARLRRIGYVPQSYTLFPHLDVRKNILFGVQSWPLARQEARLTELLALLRLEGLTGRRPAQLSGGQQQRVALARALITEPQILLLDEPFAALDSIIRGRLQEELLNLQENLGLPMVLVTHDLGEAYTLSRQIVVVEAGRVVQSADRDDVLFRPISEAVARFVGTRNIFLGRVVQTAPDTVTLESQGVPIIATRPAFPVEVGQAVHFCIRPERVLFTMEGRSRDRGSGGNYLDSQIIREIAHGTSYTLYLRLTTPLYKTTRATGYDIQVELTAEVYRRLGVADQKSWRLALPYEHLHLMATKDGLETAPGL